MHFEDKSPFLFYWSNSDPVLYYIYPALAPLLVLNLLNSKPVSYGIPYQKDLEKSRILIPIT